MAEHRRYQVVEVLLHRVGRVLIDVHRAAVRNPAASMPGRRTLPAREQGKRYAASGHPLDLARFLDRMGGP